MQRLLAVGLLLTLLGCGADVTSPEVSTVSGIRGRTLTRISTLEKQIAEGKLRAPDVRKLVVSVKYLYGHMMTQKAGTQEQIDALRTIHEQLDRRYGGRSLPGEVNARPLEQILPKLRTLVESVEID